MIFKRWANGFYSRKCLTGICAELRNVIGTVSSGGFVLDKLTWQEPMRSVSVDRPVLCKGRLRYGGTKTISVQVVKKNETGEKRVT